MDKLERALEKARQIRDVTLNGAMGSRRAPSPLQSPQNAVFPVAPNSIKIEESHLESRRILSHRTKSQEADVFRILRTQVLQIMEKSGYKTLAITSPNYGDGKTTISLNLAVSIAQDLKQTVLLVDLDLRKPNMHEFLGLNPTVGLSDYMLKNTPITECLMRLSFERLSALPAGSSVENSSELLGSPKMIALAQELKSRYPDRIIVYDMPPLLAQDDSIAFLPQVDAVLMVVRDGVTRVSEVKQCLNSLSGANVIGTVLNSSRH